MTDASASSPVRVRFCPSPTGSPHVGLARTALFNWAFARHHGGTFVFRIEDTDAARDSEESYDTLLEVMRWLGFDWDEGPEVGGPFGPYRQSERFDVYADVAAKLLEAGRAYHCYCSPEELDQRNETARSEGRAPGTTATAASCRPTRRRRSAPRVASRSSASGCPTTPSRSTTSYAARSPSSPRTCPDFVLVRGNGHPLYTLVNPVDDALMRDHPRAPRRGPPLVDAAPDRAVRRARGDRCRQRHDAAVRPPAVRHGTGQQEAVQARPRGQPARLPRPRASCPEGLLNYLALLGWAIAEDRDIFSMEEMVAAFEIDRVNPNPARFDLKKAEAINATHLRVLDVEDLTARLVPFLQVGGRARRGRSRPSVRSLDGRRRWCTSG